MSERKYNVYVAPAAGDKMYAHIRFLGQASVSAAERLYDTLCAAIDELEYNPYGYPLYTPQIPMSASLHYKLCKKRYRFVFEIIDDTVYIYDIQDCRQDIDKNIV
jgi:plasmid stabilization system protein ParE